MSSLPSYLADIQRDIEAYGRAYGLDFWDIEFESLADAGLCIENLIDPMSPFIVRKAPERAASAEAEAEAQEIPRLRSKGYMEKFINPPEYLETQRKRLERERDKPRRNPPEPERDVLQFLLQNAPLESWERDVLEIVRDDAYYFAPQRQTKIMNEGWASYWHSKIMTERALKASEIIDYADHNAGGMATAPGQWNPYKVGVELFRHIEERWDKGRFGREWDECRSLDERRSWDRRLGLGRKKLFEVRKYYSDVTFIDEFFTEEFCQEKKFFSFALNERSGNYEIDSREFAQVKHKILYQLTHFGEPFIFVEDANHENRGELLLHHRHEGVDLDGEPARVTLNSLYRIWRRPVTLLTTFDAKKKALRFDGKDHVEKAA